MERGGLIVVALYVALGITALAIDRRALLVSALAYVLFALTELFRTFGAVELNVALTAFVIGSALLFVYSAGKFINGFLADRPGPLHLMDAVHRALRAHHDERLSELLEACTAQALSAHDALPVLFKRPLNVHQMTFAMGESVAHLHMLWLSGQLQRELQGDGVYRFKTAQS